MPFTNPARRDGAIFHHWRRAAEEGKDYPFARFNKVRVFLCLIIVEELVFIPSPFFSQILLVFMLVQSVYSVCFFLDSAGTSVFRAGISDASP